MLAAVGVGAVVAPAAATATLVPKTSMDVPNMVANWGSLYGAGTTPAPDSYPTTGVYDASRTTDVCDLSTDDVAKGGVKVGDGPLWTTITAAPNPTKADLHYVYQGAEKVNVGGTYQDIVYVAYERCNSSSGSMEAVLYIDNGNGVYPSQGDNGDFLILFEFNPSKASDYTVFKRVGNKWTEFAVPAGSFEVSASQTVGQAAINITKAGILPNDPAQCASVNVGGIGGTANGYAITSDMTDLITTPTIPISNCSELKVKKTAPVDDGSTFPYSVFQKDGGVVFGPNLDASGVHDNTTAGGQVTTLKANLKVGQTDTWKKVVSSPDYKVTEGSLPSGWSQVSVTCTYTDIFSASFPTKTVTLYENSASTGNTFQLPPGVLGSASIAPSSCVIDNTFTGVRLVKQGDGDPNTEFNFTVGGDSTKLKLGGSQTFPATKGQQVVMTEGTLPSSALPWELDNVMCHDGSGASVGTIDKDNQKATVTAVEGDLITCVFTNDQSGKLIVKKKSTGGTGTFGITGTITGNITTTTSDGSVSGTPLTKLVPAGNGYSVAETPQAGWHMDSITCDNGENDPSNITIGAGEIVTCTVANTKLGAVSLTKSVSGVTSDYTWSFDFTLSPAATGGGKQTASGTGNSTSASVLSWSDLVPGTTYTISESDTTGWNSTFACKDASGATVPDANGSTAAYDVTVTPGMVLTCVVTNAAKPADLTLKKTVTGVAADYQWSFDFTLAPSATGGGKQTASGTGPGDDTLTWTNLVPGQQYVISEPGNSAYAQILTCAGVTDLDQSDLSVTFVAELGQSITCAATNAAAPSSLTLTKTVSGVDSAFKWSFDFTLSPAATGGGKQTASGTGSTTSEALMWTNLVPGTQYVISEATNGNYTQSLTCTGVTDSDQSDTSVTFVAGFDQKVTCSATNAAKPSKLDLTKSVTGVASDYKWSFDFTLAPAATGGGTQAAMGTGNTSDTLHWTNLVPGTQYVISEATNGDYTQSLTCTGVTDLDQSDTSVTFVAGFDQTVTCAASNDAKPSKLDLTKTVKGVASDYKWSFDFTLAPAATGGGLQTAMGTGNGSDTLHWTNLVPGTQYVISEATNGDYSQSLTCSGVTDTDQSDTSVTFVAGFDQTVTCAASNDAKPSKLDVTKTVRGVASDYKWSFDFTLAPAAGGGGMQHATGTGPGSDTLHWTNLVPGTQYVISEATDAGYSQSLSCSGVTDLDQVATSVTFVAGFDQTITCTATNAALPTTLQVTKTVSGVADDYKWSFDFTLAPAATGGGVQTASGTGPNSDVLLWSNLVPGTQYVVTEQTNGEYVQSLTCSGVTDLDKSDTSVTFVAGFDQDITCDATNRANPTDIQVTKSVTGVASDYKWSFDFTLAPAATGGGLQTAMGTGNTSDVLNWTNLVPGTQYVISEATNGDYTQSLTCSGVTDLDDSATSVTFVAGFDQSITCDASNAAKPSKLDVTKTVTGVASDYKWSFDFTLAPAATGGGLQTAMGTGNTSDTLSWTDLVPGTQYVISEAANGDYTQSLSCTGVEDTDDSATSVTFVAGFDQSITCAAGNDAMASALELTKTVTGVASDYAWSFDFTLAPAATGGGMQTASGTGNTTDTLDWTDLVPGTQYVISEAANGDYTQALSCTGVEDLDDSAMSVTFVAGFGQKITCAATNDAIPSTLSLTKTVSGVASDYAWSFDFTLAPAATGGGMQTASGTGNTSDTLDWTDLVPGTQYVVSEATSGDYTQALSCTGVEDTDESATTVTFVAGFGQQITCAASNAAQPSTVTLAKTVGGIADDYAWSFDFTLAPAATGGGMQTVSGVGNGTADPIVWSDLVPGTQYVISEAANGDYTQTLECTGVQDTDESDSTVTFVAGFGQAIVCGADNEAVASQLSLTKTVVGAPVDYEWSFDFTLTPAAGEVGTATLTGVGDTTSDAATFTDLVPGVTYTIAETVNADFTPKLVCDGVEDLDSSVSSVTFVAGFGQTVTCVATNTVITDEGTLSETGATLGGLAIAIILLLGGGGLVLVSRRRIA